MVADYKKSSTRQQEINRDLMEKVRTKESLIRE